VPQIDIGLSVSWAELPEELMLMVLDLLDWELRESAVVRLTCLRWRNIHDGGCKTLRVCYRDG
jgi:hypothetical protein